MATRIIVTADDIANGERDSCWYCPIALAVRRTMDTGLVGVAYGGAAVDDDYYSLPPEARAFIKDFDAGRAVNPFTFEMEPEG